jgi:hypothetical protein
MPIAITPSRPTYTPDDVISLLCTGFVEGEAITYAAFVALDSSGEVEFSPGVGSVGAGGTFSVGNLSLAALTPRTWQIDIAGESSGDVFSDVFKVAVPSAPTTAPQNRLSIGLGIGL